MAARSLQAELRQREMKITKMKKITPFLWFSDQAEEAAGFYVSCFDQSKINMVSRYSEAGAKASGRPKDSAMVVSFELEGITFNAINGGPIFMFNPSISFMVNCYTEKEINKLWEKLSPGGEVLMELEKYPFSERYGWLNDRYGVSWQLFLGNEGQKITPHLWFKNQAEEAMNFYMSLFDNASIREITRFGKDTRGPAEAIMHARFTLHGQDFMVMDMNEQEFNPSISFVINCETQEEVDFFWDQLSENGDQGSQQCGWLADRYGVSWQVVPEVLAKLLSDPDAARSGRVMKAMLNMKKIVIEDLEKAYEGL